MSSNDQTRLVATAHPCDADSHVMESLDWLADYAEAAAQRSIEIGRKP